MRKLGLKLPVAECEPYTADRRAERLSPARLRTLPTMEACNGCDCHLMLQVTHTTTIKKEGAGICDRKHVSNWVITRCQSKKLIESLAGSSFSSSGTSVLDPCAGAGVALGMIAPGEQVRRYAIELDAYRAKDATANADEVIHGSAFDCHAPVGIVFASVPESAL